MIRRPLALVVLLAALAVSGCGGDGGGSGTAAQAATKGQSAPPPDPNTIVLDDALANLAKLGQPVEAQIRDSLRMPGRLEADGTRVARIGAPVTGRIMEVRAEVGMVVKRGTQLAQINSTQLSQAQLEFLKAYSQRQLADRAAQRAKQLYDADVIGLAEMQRRESELVQQDAEVSAARDALKVLGMSNQNILNLAATRQVTSVTTLVSTLDGTIIERKVANGQVVQPADTAFIVADLANLWVVAEVPEQGSGALKKGETVRVEVAAFPGREINGKINFVGATVNPETRTVQVRMDLPNPRGEYKPAMLANVFIQGPPRLRLTVPVGAVVREENRDHVFVATADRRVVLRPVTLGAEFEGQRVIESGVLPDDRIVIDGAFHLNNERKRRMQEGR
jgi:cobalt-zinc-cadmium efflux system membrane fusion protein